MARGIPPRFSLCQAEEGFLATLGMTKAYNYVLELACPGLRPEPSRTTPRHSTAMDSQGGINRTAEHLCYMRLEEKASNRVGRTLVRCRIARKYESTTFQKRKKSIPADARSADQIVDYIQADFVITGNNKGTRNSRLLQLDVTSLLAGTPVPDLFKHTNEFSPRQRS